MIKSGNVTINPESYKGSSKEKFIEDFKGKLVHDINIIWDQVCQCNINSEKLKNESISSVSEPYKAIKNKRTTKNSIRK